MIHCTFVRMMFFFCITSLLSINLLLLNVRLFGPKYYTHLLYRSINDLYLFHKSIDVDPDNYYMLRTARTPLLLPLPGNMSFPFLDTKAVRSNDPYKLVRRALQFKEEKLNRVPTKRSLYK